MHMDDYFNKVYAPNFKYLSCRQDLLKEIILFGGAERLHTIRAFLQMRSIDLTSVDKGILTETIKRRGRSVRYCILPWQSSRSGILGNCAL